jgi:ABC-type cobalamin/Fe3+-siderophores transport system ATPase subunit
VLEVKGLCYKGVLKDIAFSTPPGKVVGIAGRNGAGKTTLLRCIGGYHHYRGSVKWNGKEIRKLPLKERTTTVNYLPQSVDMMFPFTVAEFLKASVPVCRKGIEETLEFLRISHLLSRRVDSLSGGEKAKVLLARLLVIDPSVYLLDEPTAFLDLEVLSLVAGIIARLKEKGRLVLLTSHDVNFLLGVCDLFLGLKNSRLYFFAGRQEFLESLEEIYSTEVFVWQTEEEVFVRPVWRRT